MDFDRNLLEDPAVSSDFVASKIVKLISSFNESILEIENRQARRELEASCKNAFHSIARSQNRVVLLPEMIPGMALLSFRLMKEAPACRDEYVQEETTEDSASELVRLFSKNSGNRVISLRSRDLLMLLFPMEDMARNLAEIGVK